MLEIQLDEQGTLFLCGRFDASQEEVAMKAFARVVKSTHVDCSKLDYISSAGIGVLIATQKRLMQNKEQLLLRNLNPHVVEIFKYAGLDAIFSIE
jgi:anti-sigma B factor antagonist